MLNFNKVKYLLIGVIVGLLFSSNFSFSGEQIKLIINNKEIQSDVSPQIINDRVLVPVRVISENLNCDVQWDEINQQVVITSRDNVANGILQQTQNQESLYEEINYHDDNFVLDSPPIKYNGNIYFPLSYIKDKFNLDNIAWNPSTKIYSIREINIEIDTTNKNDFIFYRDSSYVRNGIVGNIQISN